MDPTGCPRAATRAAGRAEHTARLAEGECRIIGTSPTCARAGQANRLAQRVSGAWVFYMPRTGLVVVGAATWAH
ncbi:DUF2793 domain-containing protein [Falsiroseomonas sp.]|uniref:DUF2793 domain-containing protein n=1 Tax=Falsiroseomonas sp. TaxID=2870721 RepID=UPI003563168A